jgi:transposase
MPTIPPAFRGAGEDAGVGINVRELDRDQQFLMPPSVADWLPEGHLAWFVLDVVAELDLSRFYATFREDGRGGAAYDPSMLLAVLLYAYCVGERSSRRVEARLVEDVAFRVVAANQRPDHATLARFRRRHEDAIAELFGQVLGLCVQAGLVDAGLVAVDGTKMGANASAWSNRTRRQLAEEILGEAEQVDAAEDEQFGDQRGDELPGEWADRRDRRARVREALRQLDAQGAADWESYLAERAAKEAELGRKLSGRKPNPEGKKARDRHANVTDPDSRMLRSTQRFVQGYNAQAAVTGDQVVVAAAVTNAANDTTQLEPMLALSAANLDAAGYEGSMGTVVADAGYWSTDNATIDTAAELLIATVAASNSATDSNDRRIAKRRAVLERLDRGELTITAAGREMGISPTWTRQLLAAHRRRGPDPAVVRDAMDTKLASPHGKDLYARRKTTVEPVFGDIKTNRGYRRFARRGLRAVTSEWRLICAAHNLRKLWRRQTPALIS